ncbi:MAG: ThuA domain-containing protein [Candidatus Hydrogenedentota bacterium]
MRTISRITAACLFAALLSLTAQADEDTLSIHIISGSAEYESEPSLRALQRTLEDDYEDIVVTASWGEDAGDHLHAICALAEADLALIFTRRMELPDKQLEYILQHFEAEKAAIGIRPASHAFQDYLEMDEEIFGGDYSGHGGDEPVKVEIVEGAEDHPILDGVEPWTRPGKIYHNPELGPETTPLLWGIGQDSDIEEPLAWTNHYGEDGRAFYTSMGMPEDFENENFRTMLFNAIEWTTGHTLRPVDGQD